MLNPARTWVRFVLWACLLSCPVAAQSKLDWTAIQNESLTLFFAYLKLDTTTGE